MKKSRYNNIVDKNSEPQYSTGSIDPNGIPDVEDFLFPSGEEEEINDNTSNNSMGSRPSEEGR